MSKVFNRSVVLGGTERDINSITVQVLTYDKNDDVLMSSGTTVPTGSGYAKGALFIKTDAASGTKGLYENQGTNTSASFNLIGDISSAELDPDLQLEGTTIANQDSENSTAFRVRGLQHSSEGGAAVQNYAGIFNNNAWDTVGSLKTRATFSGNADMDLSFQTPERLLLLAEGSGDSSSDIAILAEANVTFHLRADSEAQAPNRLILDRVTTGSTGASNTSDVNIDVNTGNLRLMANNTTGAPIVNSLTDGERDALTPVKGMIIYNETQDEYQLYDGAWKQITVSAAS